MVSPVLHGNFRTIEAKEVAETRYANDVQARLKSMVWSGGCSNWNLDRAGRNTTNSPDNTFRFWMDLYYPVWKDFNLSGGKGTVPWNPIWKYAAGTLSVGLLTQAILFRNVSMLQPLVEHLRGLGPAIIR
jgi:hypothetical protein